MKEAIHSMSTWNFDTDRSGKQEGLLCILIFCVDCALGSTGNDTGWGVQVIITAGQHAYAHCGARPHSSSRSKAGLDNPKLGGDHDE